MPCSCPCTYGTTTILPVEAAYWIGSPGNAGESNGGPFVYYNFAGQDNETTADSGGVTLTTYTADTEVDGTVDATFPEGGASCMFQAVYCATLNEL